MKIIIDNSNIYLGGGVQVTISFINDLRKLNLDNEYHLIQSSNIFHLIDKKDFPDNFLFYDLNKRTFKSKFARRRQVKKIENLVKPDIIFTVFGPSYHKSNYPKVVGFAIPYLIYPDSPFFQDISITEQLKFKSLSIIKSLAFKRFSDVIIFETDNARARFLANSKICGFTVGNTLNEIFNDKSRWINFDINVHAEFNILCLSAAYTHKNLQILPGVIDEMLRLGLNEFKFNISLNQSEIYFGEKYDSYINYLGKINLVNLPNLYQQMDALFMPTLLEVFSTTYLEAMEMEIPIVASDMPFARDICHDSAIYCQPLVPLDYAKAFQKLILDPHFRKELTLKGKKNLQRFGKSLDRTKSYLSILEKTVMKFKNK